MNNKILDCIKGNNSNYTPIWFMRQAGRYLPEFRKIRIENQDFVKLCLNSNLSSIITLQPIAGFGNKQLTDQEYINSKYQYKIKFRDVSQYFEKVNFDLEGEEKYGLGYRYMCRFNMFHIWKEMRVLLI